MSGEKAMLNRAMFAGMWVLAVALLGCSQSQDATQTGDAAGPDAAYLLVSMPANVQGVEDARKESENDQEIAVEGRIGGEEKPFVDGIAAFTLIDSRLHWCAADENCPTPWDYCCSNKTGKLAAVQVVGGDGQPVAKDARALLGVKELSKVVVCGKAKRDEQGNLTVLAEKVHVVEK
jgi:hypothetical protein